jgi:hypothetical protein
MTNAMRWGVLALVLGGVCVGCNTSTCDRAEDGLTVTNLEGVHGDNTWFSAPYHDPNRPLEDAAYQYFPPARTITFVHDLDSLPVYGISLAFSDHGSLAESTGNSGIVECMDDHVFQIKNDTCSDFYVWVTLQGSGIHADQPCEFDADAGADVDAGTDAGAAGASP